LELKEVTSIKCLKNEKIVSRMKILSFMGIKEKFLQTKQVLKWKIKYLN
jgi:hypothetical protein